MIKGFRNAEIIPPDADERSVTIMILGPFWPLAANIFIVEPALKKSQPTTN